MNAAIPLRRATYALAALFLSLSLTACSDSIEEGAECPPGEILNPVLGSCQPRTSGGGDPDGGTGNAGGPADGGTGNNANNANNANNGSTGDMGTAGDMSMTNDCTGTERRCNGSTVEICSGGTFTLLETCVSGFICNLGNCVPENMDSCTPGATRCASRTSTETCASDGESYEPAVPCGEDEECQGGVCTRSCAGFIDKKSNVGCEYLTMRHDQRTGFQTLPHTVVVSNPNADPVTVSVSSPAGIQHMIPNQTIQPNDSAVLNFPTSPMIAAPGVTRNLYVITSSLPVIATQFSPLNNPGLGSETSDASLLLPTNAIGNEYVVLGWRAAEPSGTWIDIVATEPNTMVSVEAPLPLNGGSAGSVAENSSQTFNLSENEVLHLEEGRGFIGSGTRDVSGVRITSNNPIAVYTGATITNIPLEPIEPSNDPSCIETPPSGQEESATSCIDNSACCSGMCAHDPGLGTQYCVDFLGFADHIEQQLFPVETWGSSYVAVPFPSRSSNDYTIFRLVAGTDGTNVTLDPPVDGVSSLTLNRGEFTQLTSTTPFEVTADQPVMLGQFMIGGTISTSEDGDPAFLLPPAVEQYRDAYVFLVPGNYRRNRVTFVKSSSAQITLDGSPVAQSEFTAIGTTGWEYATITSLAAGVHNATSTEAFGVVVHGADEYISYAFAGGVTLPQ